MLCKRVAMMKAGRIVALDTTRNLLARDSGPTLSFALADDAALPAALQSRAQPLPGGRYRLALADYAQVEQMLADCRLAGVRVRDLEVGQPDLEDVFVQIMAANSGRDLP
jgi:ABC-2 type transport system ATP-binding protein